MGVRECGNVGIPRHNWGWPASASTPFWPQLDWHLDLDWEWDLDLDLDLDPDLVLDLDWDRELSRLTPCLASTGPRCNVGRIAETHTVGSRRRTPAAGESESESESEAGLSDRVGNMRHFRRVSVPCAGVGGV